MLRTQPHRTYQSVVHNSLLRTHQLVLVPKYLYLTTRSRWCKIGAWRPFGGISNNNTMNILKRDPRCDVSSRLEGLIDCISHDLVAITCQITLVPLSFVATQTHSSQFFQCFLLCYITIALSHQVSSLLHNKQPKFLKCISRKQKQVHQ